MFKPVCVLLLSSQSGFRRPLKEASNRTVTDNKVVTPFLTVEQTRGRIYQDHCHQAAMPVGPFLIPPQSEAHAGYPTVVLDMDETLVFARRSIVHPRPHLADFLQFLKGSFEIVLWTAGTEDYARHVLAHIDPHGAISHCIFRSPLWFPEDSEESDRKYMKKLQLLGRQLSRTLMIENTPECCLEARENSILIPDFECNSLADAHRSTDTILRDLLPILGHFVDPLVAVPSMMQALHKQGLLTSSEFRSLTLGSLGKFYYIGMPTRTMPTTQTKHSAVQRAWPKDCW